MKIKEVIERECCAVEDLKPIHARPANRWYGFCIHCGRHWEDLGLESNPGSDTPSGLQPLPWPWENIR